jgi:hypothetical protein
LFEKSNDDILKIADHHFDVPKEDYDFTRMKPTKNFNQVNKPTLNTHDDYVNKYASFLNSVDKDLWPTISNLLEIFKDGLASKTFKKTFNKFDPVEEIWQRNSKDYERNIFNDDGNFFKRRNYYKKFHNSNRYHRSYGKYNKDYTRNESKKSTSKEYYYKLKRKSSNCTLMDSTNGSKDTGRRIKESSSGTNLTISDVFLNHDYAIDIPDVDDSDDDVLVNLDARNMLDRLAIDINRGEISVEQAALRPVQLDRIRSRKGDRITDCHPQSMNVDHALNREVHGGKFIELAKVQVDNKINRIKIDSLAYKRDSLDSFIDSCIGSRNKLDSRRIIVDSEIDVDSYLLNSVEINSHLNRKLIRTK